MLRTLTCTACGLSGSLPGWQLFNLQQLFLQRNFITGGLPAVYQGPLNTLDLSYNQLMEVPADGYFTYYAYQMKVLVLRGNKLNGTLPGGE